VRLYARRQRDATAIGRGYRMMFGLPTSAAARACCPGRLYGPGDASRPVCRYPARSRTYRATGPESTVRNSAAPAIRNWTTVISPPLPSGLNRCSEVLPHPSWAGSHRGHRLDPHRATEPPGTIVRFCTVVIHEDMVVAAIAKQGAAQSSYLSRCFHPARRLRIEISKLLQIQVLFFRQKLNPHGSSHISGAVFWFVFFP